MREVLGDCFLPQYRTELRQRRASLQADAEVVAPLKGFLCGLRTLWLVNAPLITPYIYWKGFRAPPPP